MILIFFQIIISILLIVAILLQMQGSGLSAAFGATSEFYRSKRSIEKVLFWTTILLSLLFAIVSVALLVPTR